MKTALILFPHQLYKPQYLPSVDIVYMVEEPLYFGTDNQYPMFFHKQKIMLHRASMQRFVKEVLWPAGVEVNYFEISPESFTGEVVAQAAIDKIEQLIMFDPTDEALLRRMKKTVTDLEMPIPLKVLDSPNFYLKSEDVYKYFSAKKKHLFANFYQWQRERFNILIDENYHPVGGKWSFDTENRKRMPSGHVPPGLGTFGDNEYVRDAREFVEKMFPNNPGSSESFIWPTNHEEAEHWLKQFIEQRLEMFGPYEDAIEPDALFLYHSALTAMLNIGLLQPYEVIDAVLAYHQQKPLPIESLEGFVRQILGWREYVRGMYLVYGTKMRNSNFFNHKRLLGDSWYQATTTIAPLDAMVKKLWDHAYAHHIERLMVAGNLMLLSEINPHEVYRWFMELFIDSYDWVMVPNVYGMSQFADGGSMTTKPYMSGSNYILTMSNLKKDQWCDVWDGLFWKFIDDKKAYLAKNPRLKVMVNRSEKMDQSRRRIIGYRADDFLKNHTKNN